MKLRHLLEFDNYHSQNEIANQTPFEILWQQIIRKVKVWYLFSNGLFFRFWRWFRNWKRGGSLTTFEKKRFFIYLLLVKYLQIPFNSFTHLWISMIATDYHGKKNEKRNILLHGVDIYTHEQPQSSKFGHFDDPKFMASAKLSPQLKPEWYVPGNITTYSPGYCTICK